MESKARAALRVLADLVWPPQSPLSGRPVSAPGELDAEDWTAISFLDAPWCDRCGAPFDYPSYEGMACAPCTARPPVWSKARSAMVYDAASRALPLSLKHAGRTDALAAFGRWMTRAGREFLPEADALVPVPLHPSRLRKRRFNQSLLLARAVSAASGVPVEPHALARVRKTGTQGGLTAKSRTRNVAGAFRVRDRFRDRIADRRIVLIDDVHTTGATLSACVRALKRAGAAEVNALTLARVVKPVDPLK
ncbi:MAG: ComF family protein [Oceanicaulis sp.]